MPVDKDYGLDTDDGTRALAELFEGRPAAHLPLHVRTELQGWCPTNSSIGDAVDGIVRHLNAHDVTMLFVVAAPLETLQAYKRRMGWRLPWASSADSEFNVDLGFSSSAAETREAIAPIIESLPPIVAHNAHATGTDVFGYLTESPGFSAFALEHGAIYRTYSTGARGVEFVMSYYPILDRAPKGRDEGDAFQTWLRRHDEYPSRDSRHHEPR